MFNFSIQVSSPIVQSLQPLLAEYTNAVNNKSQNTFPLSQTRADRPNEGQRLFDLEILQDAH